METLQDLLHTFAGNTNPAIIIPQKIPVIVSYNDLYNQVQYLQGELASLGLSSGSRLSIILPNSAEFITLFLAISCMRAVAVPINPTLKQGEYGFYLEDLSPDAIAVPKGAFCERHAAVLAALDKGITIVECHYSEGRIVFDSQQDVALILHTSGTTTGRPKAVPLTHQNLLASMINVCTTYKLNPRDRTILIIPIFHIHGLLASTLAPLYSGGTVIIPTRLTPSFWTDFITYKATWYTGTPTSHALILQYPRPTPTPPPLLRFIRSGSAPLSPSLHQNLEQAFRVPVLNNYAMTEACGQIASKPLPPTAPRKPGSVGTATGVEIQILDPQGKPLPADTEGEICIRGPGVTSGYLNNEIANAKWFTSDDFFRTGDYGRCDGDGYLFLTGRIEEVVNKGGEKISPAELDGVVVRHPAVVEAAAFAVADELYGQDVAVAVRVGEGEEIDGVGLRRWVRGRVAGFKVPAKIFFVKDIPKTATGKVRRDVLAQMVVGKGGMMSKL